MKSTREKCFNPSRRFTFSAADFSPPANSSGIRAGAVSTAIPVSYLQSKSKSSLTGSISTTGSASPSRTPTVNSRPSTYASYITVSPPPPATSVAASTSATDLASVNRTDDPPDAGFTITGRPSRSAATDPGTAPRVQPGVATPSSLSSLFVRSLDIASEHATGPLPA